MIGGLDGLDIAAVVCSLLSMWDVGHDAPPFGMIGKITNGFAVQSDHLSQRLHRGRMDLVQLAAAPLLDERIDQGAYGCHSHADIGPAVDGHIGLNVSTMFPH